MKKITPEMFVNLRKMISYRNVCNDIKTQTDIITQCADDDILDELYALSCDYCDSLSQILKKLIHHGNEETEN